ncbi:ATP-binding protein [Lysinibacillus sp. BW-2-10]|uniref:ATP-binding protein n=1 Tax=Lysinibacillus sp. BW-2-10 TaxID=2590030 RepID=UPI002103D35D|nr:ATP-binding protein [Lysinibacillus sp. BW-2-10]
MVKAINLLSLLSARYDLSYTNFTKYIQQFGMNPKIRLSELDDLKSLVDEMQKNTSNYNIYNNFYYGFMINRIGKEFDLLRIGQSSVVNIELKRESNEEKITRQLLQNDYYLKFLDKEVHNFTFVSSTKKLYMLMDNHVIKEVQMDRLIERLEEQQLIHIEDLDDVFDPSNYLVSPFNSPHSFMKDKYFLSAQQSTYKREILNLTPTDQTSFIVIEGGPGTGKSLLTYDIAKEYMKNSKKVLIFNCGRLNKGHEQLIAEYNWPIEPISNFNKAKQLTYDFSQYDVIIFDEAQALYKNKFIKVVELIKDLKIKCIFSLDPDRVLTNFEMNNNIPKLIQEKLNPVTYELTTIIRHNKEIHSFINNMFDLARPTDVQKFPNVTLQYFSSKTATKNYLQYLRGEGWKIIDYSRSNYIENPDNDHSKKGYRKDIHGIEFDHVVAVIDGLFYYKTNGKLAAKTVGKKLNDQPVKMLYQNIIRTRKKLHLVVVQNTEVLNKLLKILNS